ncbi:MAG: hypothetical protein WCW25_03395 [Patescibacteria group bacterium]|jgi:hypothetical protein
MKIRKLKNYFSAIFLLSAALLFTGAYFYFSFLAGRAADSKGSPDFNDTEVIYDYLDCSEGTCGLDTDGKGRDSKALFKFFGRDADCLNLKVDCKDLTLEKCKEAFKNEYDACRKNFNYGQAGSFEMAGDLKVNGIRTYIDGYDNFGRHWYKSGRENEDTGQIALLDNARGVLFSGNIYLQGNTAIFEYGPNIIGWNLSKGERITLGEDVMDFFSRNIKLARIDWFGMRVETGLEVKDMRINNGISWRSKKLGWSPVIGNTTTAAYKGSGENKQIFMYCDNGLLDCLEQ